MQKLTLLNPNQSNTNDQKIVYCQKQITPFEVDGKTFLFDSNNLNLWEIAPELLKNLEKDSIAADRVPFCTYDGTAFTHKGYIVFQATYACNLKCRYCFVEHHYCDHTNSIDIKTAIKALDVYQPAWQQFGHKIGFFGGEPLMNWEFIYKLVNFVVERIPEPNKRDFHVTTNATLITEEIAEFLAKHNFTLIVSVDGEESTHNESRPYRNMQGNSFADTLRGLEFLKRAYEKIGKTLKDRLTLRSTFDRHGVDLVARLEFLNNLAEQGYGGHVSVEPACLTESCAGGCTMEDLTREELRAQFLNEYIQAAKWYADRKQQGKFTSYHHAESFIERILNHKYSFSECGAAKGYLSVGPNGKVCACHREHGSELGSIGKIDIVQQEKWMDNRLYARANCPECPIRYICGGGCRCNSALVLHNLKMPTVAECAFREMQIEMAFLSISLLQKNDYEFFPNEQKPPLNSQSPSTQQQQAVCKKPDQLGTKQVPPCGLELCLDKNCPFPSCGKQSAENLERAKAKIQESQCVSVKK